IQRAAMLQAAPDLDDDEDGLTPRARPFANTAAPEDLQLWYQVAVAGRRDLPLAPSPRAGCEMVLLRMLAFRFAAPASGPGSERPQPSQRAVRTPAAPRSQAAPPGSDDWDRMIESMDLAGATRQLARHCEYLGLEAG